MSEEKQDLPLLPPPPSYDECSKDYPPRQENKTVPSGYPGTQPTDHAATSGYTGVQSTEFLVQPGFQSGFQVSTGFQQGAPPFFYQGQPQYPMPQPHQNRPYPQVSYSFQQTCEQLIPGQPYNTTQVVVTHTQPVQQPMNVATTTRPPDYMIPAILACMFCFCPLGFTAIIYAHDANRMAMSGNMTGAKFNANAARGLIIASVVAGVGIILVITLVAVLRST
ncbi:proline rich transmembrane protein 1B-like isoform X2 [Dreissena polymorpha]|uniref:Uncharacterized protein n=1 Tax=Dreissena polymorpha TaxID=45954 RepID=A0A9D4K836_DREPO|nr:proline rich transmembrane protein 1B-like isoform X2 [Dreissena polymorpha]KAH3834833.1 hypothetical protein DPMN_108166 [Dreissena polymorpha]